MGASLADSPKPSRGWIWVVVGTVVFALFIFGLVARAVLHDAPPPDDVDLRTPPPMVADSQNGFRVIGKIDDKTLDFLSFAESQGVDEMTARKILDGDESNETLVSAFIVKAQSSLKQIDEALTKPSFELSREVTMETLVPENAQFVASGKMLMLSARDDKARGDYTAGVREISQIYLLAKRVAMAHGNLLVMIAATALEGCAVREAMIWVNDPRTPPEALAGLTAIFTDEIPWRESFQFSHKLEYQFIRNTLLQMRDHPEQFENDSKIAHYRLQLNFLAYSLKVTRPSTKPANISGVASNMTVWTIKP